VSSAFHSSTAVVSQVGALRTGLQTGLQFLPTYFVRYPI